MRRKRLTAKVIRGLTMAFRLVPANAVHEGSELHSADEFIRGMQKYYDAGGAKRRRRKSMPQKRRKRR